MNFTCYKAIQCMQYTATLITYNVHIFISKCCTCLNLSWSYYLFKSSCTVNNQECKAILKHLYKIMIFIFYRAIKNI